MGMWSWINWNRGPAAVFLTSLFCLVFSGCATRLERYPSGDTSNLSGYGPSSQPIIDGKSGTHPSSLVAAKDLSRVQARVDAWESAEGQSLRERCREGKLWKRYGGITICRRELQEQDRMELEWAKIELSLARALRETESKGAVPSENLGANPMTNFEVPVNASPVRPVEHQSPPGVSAVVSPVVSPADEPGLPVKEIPKLRSQTVKAAGEEKPIADEYRPDTGFAKKAEPVVAPVVAPVETPVSAPAAEPVAAIVPTTSPVTNAGVPDALAAKPPVLAADPAPVAKVAPVVAPKAASPGVPQVGPQVVPEVAPEIAKVPSAPKPAPPAASVESKPAIAPVPAVATPAAAATESKAAATPSGADAGTSTPAADDSAKPDGEPSAK